MSHGIEMRKLITGETGSFVGSRDEAWHGLGLIADHDLTIEEAIRLLNPGQIVKMPLYADFVINGGPTAVGMGNMGTFRVREVEGVTDVTPLGTVSTSYPIFQDIDNFRFLGRLIADHGAVVSATGLLNDGKRAFMCLKLPKTVMVGGSDEVQLFIFCYVGHDGTLQFSVGISPIRVVCHNTVTLAMSQAPALYQVKHTSRAVLDEEKARETLGIVESYPGIFAAYAERMMATKVTNDTFDRMVRQMWGKEADRPGASKKAVTQFKLKLDLAMDLWTGSGEKGSTGTNAGITGTAWGAFNVGVEMTDWFTSVRNLGAQDGQKAQTRRLEKALQGDNADTKAKWQNVVMAMA